MSSSSPKPKVYRLRGCPIHLDKSRTAELLSRELGDVAPTDIVIQSLATNLDPWARPPTKVGTLMFRKLPALVREENGNDEWILPVVGLEKVLILDTHFMGMTPLNEVEHEKWIFDCIAISGLASHPFGSWQPKGKDKSFMWIRDELPSIMPEARISIYGYDTALVGSKSFQTIQDLAISFIDHMKASGQNLPSAKPLIFLAHSLGGIVLKEVFTILADSDIQNAHILELFKGGIFFGVPSQGMSVEHLLTMVKGQKNYQIVENLSMGSKYLQDLDDKFSGLSLTRSMHLYWGYETKMSPTIMKMPDGSFRRAGSEDILVSKESATRNIYSSQPLNIFPINENHSEMVKFRTADPNFNVPMSKLRELRDDVVRTINEIPHSTIDIGLAERDRAESCTINNVMDSLRIPGQDHRFDTIDKNFRHTFKWVFDAQHTSLSSWLGDESGMFWIHGKPGSGKSTLMKFIAEDKRTWEHLHEFSSGALGISAMFFFHDRGGLLQKSFEGLLRSILYQIIEQARKSGVEITELTKHLFKCLSTQRRQTQSLTLNTLENSLRHLLQQRLLDLKIFLLLDALDEYDGQPGFICRFLQDMIRVTAGSRTKLKILFSSRYWEEFRRGFEDVPSIQLQDHTTDDIENYCWGMVASAGSDLSVILSPVIPKVIDRANGVFLWVKLALHELIREAPQKDSPEELTSTLNSIPSNLQDYYIRTVHRIPENLRRDAFVIFESLSKTIHTLGLFDMINIIDCSKMSNYRDCRESFEEWGYWASIDNEGFAQVKSRILTSTGGLAEVVGYRKLDLNVQFIHQTVKDFVHSRDFNQTFSAILGPRDKRREGNGHTFLTKYYLASGKMDRFGENLFDHESTTGHSLKDLIDSIPNELHPKLFPSRYGVRGPLTLALFFNLQLYLEEKLRYEPNIFRNTKEDLLCVVSNGYATLQKSLDIFQLLLDNGYTVKQDQNFLATIRGFPSSLVDAKATMVVARLQDLNTWHPIPSSPSKGLSRFLYKKRPHLVKILHQAKTPKLTQYVLDHGAEVNEPDSWGSTPLDHVVRYWEEVIQGKSFGHDPWAPTALYRTANLLIGRGGIVTNTTKKQWKAFVEFLREYCQRAGDDVTELSKDLQSAYLGSTVKARELIRRLQR
ncbi:hypothetical protein F4805DRAFT_463413 [Annulohypoxylon moriforme]|nr:hypothetical protein F4805DRAFT_463413 [Annulohypoxylon moriforme]